MKPRKNEEFWRVWRGKVHIRRFKNYAYQCGMGSAMLKHENPDKQIKSAKESDVCKRCLRGR